MRDARGRALMASAETEAAVHRQLGELAAGMRALQDTMRRIEEGAGRAEDKAAESRAGVHRRMDEIVGRVRHLETSTATIVSDVSEMKPVTDDVRRWKLMGIGSLGMIGIGGIALGVSFADVLKRIAALLVGRI